MEIASNNNNNNTTNQQICGWAKVLVGEKGKENPNVWKKFALVHNMSNKLK
jgi:hypothetical protein